MTGCRSIASHAARLVGMLALALVAGCAADRDPPSEPSFYRSLAEAGGQLDAATAASMISGYRSNNGLTPVTVDPELMKLADAQARAMASRDKPPITTSFAASWSAAAQGHQAKTAAETSRPVTTPGGSVLRLARSAAPRQHAAQRRHPWHRGGLRAEIQGVLADPGRARRAAGRWAGPQRGVHGKAQRRAHAPRGPDARNRRRVGTAHAVEQVKSQSLAGACAFAHPTGRRPTRTSPAQMSRARWRAAARPPPRTRRARRP